MTEITKYTAAPSTVATSDVSATAFAMKASYAQTSTQLDETVATFSTLAQQISDAAIRATARGAKLTRSELTDTAKAVLNKFSAQSDQWNKERYDAAIPETDNPELLARAKQATDFLNNKSTNPFLGMSRDKLVLITFDNAGPFTVNERKAAWSEAYRQEEIWREQVVGKAMDSYNSNGNLFGNGVGKAMLEHHRSLPLIEQSLYPASYEAELQIKIATSGQDTRQTLKMEPMSLLYLLNKWAKAREEHGLPALDGSGEDSRNAAPAFSGAQDASLSNIEVAPAAPQVAIDAADKPAVDTKRAKATEVDGLPADTAKALKAMNEPRQGRAENNS
ncbi:hypothetical protein [Herbaspirillum sp. alder98]|uniref:hypothetical protein n=1 Tax=Herbaspirillum sp. alder98 TaxID=2913096 RepID=UPI001CD90FE3|nr:hypothetical protein [Herbaspirillum sp. alder98]MCA1324527.1 hypothetical protein [Herbaspirillum sp. alder98]